MIDFLKTMGYLVLIAVIVGVVIKFAFHVQECADNAEISPEQYQQIKVDGREYPEIRPLLKRILDDDKITAAEHRQFIVELEKVSKQRTIRSLQQLTTTETSS